MNHRRPPSKSSRQRRLPLWAELGLWTAAVYVVLAAINLAAPPDAFCVTNSWCIPESHWWLIAAVQTVGFILIVVAFRFAIVWAVAMLVSPRRHWWMLLFFGALGAGGIVAWIATVPPAEWLASIHVPLIGAMFVGIGVAMFIGFKRRSPPRRPPSR